MTLRPATQPSSLDHIAESAFEAAHCPQPRAEHAHAPSQARAHQPPPGGALWLDFFERVLRR